MNRWGRIANTAFIQKTKERYYTNKSEKYIRSVVNKRRKAIPFIFKIYDFTENNPLPKPVTKLKHSNKYLNINPRKERTLVRYYNNKILSDTHPMTISKNDFLHWWAITPNECNYCGTGIKRYIHIKNFILNHHADNQLLKYLKHKVFNHSWCKLHKRMTIDRIDNSKPYTIDNIVKACWICNCLKKDHVYTNKLHTYLVNVKKALRSTVP